MYNINPIVYNPFVFYIIVVLRKPFNQLSKSLVIKIYCLVIKEKLILFKEITRFTDRRKEVRYIIFVVIILRYFFQY